MTFSSPECSYDQASFCSKGWMLRYLAQLGVNKPSVIPCAAQLLKALGVDGLTEGSFIPPSTSYELFLLPEQPHPVPELYSSPENRMEKSVLDVYRY